jgi:hypothetical protein
MRSGASAIARSALAKPAANHPARFAPPRGSSARRHSRARRDRATIAGDGFRPAAHGLQRAPEVGVRRREIRCDRERAPDQPDRALMSPALVRDHPEQVQRVGMVGGFLQHSSIERLGPVASSRLVMRKGRVKIADNPGAAPGVLLIASGCHSCQGAEPCRHHRPGRDRPAKKHNRVVI